MNKILIIIFIVFLNTINSFCYEIPDQYFYCNFGYGYGLGNSLPHNLGFNLTLYDMMAKANRSRLFSLIEEEHHIIFISPLGLKVNAFIEYEGINYFGYEKYIPPKKIIQDITFL
jgi:hypothetical protein